MSTPDFLATLYNLDRDEKIYANHNGYSVAEIRLFCLHDAPTVKEMVYNVLRALELGDNITFRDVEIIHHYHHYKRYRFYELKLKTKAKE